VGQQVFPGQTIATLPLLSEMEAEIFVLEVDAGGLKEGQRADLTIEAHSTVSYPATVKRVDKLARPRIRGVPVQYFAVVLSLEKTDPALMKPGQRVRATLMADETKGLVIPRQAVFDKDGKKIVYRQKAGGDFEPAPVELGNTTWGRIVVTAGLAAGDRVALTDPTRKKKSDGPGKAGAVNASLSESDGEEDFP
jgi:multidrug resistance efflux pump